jgi:hypothetical protein
MARSPDISLRVDVAPSERSPLFSIQQGSFRGTLRAVEVFFDSAASQTLDHPNVSVLDYEPEPIEPSFRNGIQYLLDRTEVHEIPLVPQRAAVQELIRQAVTECRIPTVKCP